PRNSTSGVYAMGVPQAAQFSAAAQQSLGTRSLTLPRDILPAEALLLENLSTDSRFRGCVPMTTLDFDWPTGERVTPSQLPVGGRKNLGVREKVLVVAAVRHGMLTFLEACTRYDLNVDQFL